MLACRCAFMNYYAAKQHVLFSRKASFLVAAYGRFENGQIFHDCII